MLEIIRKVEEILDISESKELIKHLEELDNLIAKKSLELTDKKFTAILTKSVLEPINDRIHELLQSTKGKSGRVVAKKKKTTENLSVFVQSLYSNYPQYLESYEGYKKYLERRETKNLNLRDFIFNFEGDSLSSALYPLDINESKLKHSAERIKEYISKALKKPHHFEFGVFHLNSYYKEILKSLSRIDVAIKRSEEQSIKLTERDAKTSIHATYYNQETDSNESLKDEIASLIECNSIEHSNLIKHRAILSDLKDYILAFYKDLLNNDIESFESNKNCSKIENNPFPEIFTSDNAYSLFLKFRKSITEKTELADYSFIYRSMQRDKLIQDILRESDYRRWLNKEFEITIDKTKVLNACSTPTKEFAYELLKEQFSL